MLGGSARDRSALAGVLLLATGALAALAPPAQADPLPPTAVAMGDSFISGEGAGGYQPVTDQSGVAQGFPGWSAANSNAYFCHRSVNASIQVADLPGITRRVNLACSGAQPADMAAASSARPAGRTVAAQIVQLRTVAQTGDIDLVLLGLGSNNSQFTFGGVAAECAGRFVADGYTGWWEVWIHFVNWVTGEELNERACSDADFATAAQLGAARAETTAAVRQVLDVLDEVDADGDHRVVLQDYTNPLPPAYAEQYRTEDGRTDTRDKYRALVDERYAAGCPADIDSLAPAQRFSQNLGTLVAGVASTIQAERPTAKITYLNVQRAFDGARLCEQPGSPGNALATPLRVMDGPSGVHVQSFTPYDKLDIKRVTDTCQSYYQTCQESWHPNAAGQRALGTCLRGAWLAGTRSVTCVRGTSGAIMVQ
ncbi:hypothetical protein ASC64_08275 [Nocardioides sp. Root122]|uniref:hypothetical protein n=1 Tax=Nocardioides TaxID=1839 RepID=UPI000702C817|nr:MULTISPECIES: hypothetical protein [Nocardioides]KQV69806.1 hypothetical protein ASC64_08275 [Nocardioides sp. Root122]MCK9822981.1 hypothetical protein [Nocardioides cavernae]